MNDLAQYRCHLGGSDIKAGDWLSVDGEAGAIYRGRRDIVAERPQAKLSEVERWRACRG